MSLQDQSARVERWATEISIDIQQLATVLIPTVLIIAAETALFFGSSQQAIWGHVIALLILVSAPLYLDENIRIIQAFLLIPLFRIINLGMPILFNISLLWYPLIYAPLYPGGILIASLHDVSLFKDWKFAILAAPLMLPFSALLSGIEYSVITPGALILDDSLTQVAVIGFVMLFFVGFVEELLYRAILQRTLRIEIGRIPALIIANVLFGMMHSAYGTPWEIVFAGSLGFVYGIVYEYRENLILVTILHGLLNTFLFGIFPLNETAYALPWTL